MTKKVVVGMSGGVDSSVAAYLLKEQDYDVIGVTMKFWREAELPSDAVCRIASVRTDDDVNRLLISDDDEGHIAANKISKSAGSFLTTGGGEGHSAIAGVDAGFSAYIGNSISLSTMSGVDTGLSPFVCSEDGFTAAKDAGRVAEMLSIPHYVFNFETEFKRSVVDYFVEEYLQGRTPNPCTACNRYVKWEALMERSRELGADYLATGHYARIVRLPNGRYTLRNSVTAAKDQTYALYNLTQSQLSHTLMPVGEYPKETIRQIAERLRLPVADKPDSQEICFIPDHDYAAFIEREAGPRVPPPGNFVTPDERILGRHKGITHYTIGQRRGLGLALGHHVFVTEIRPETNEVVIGEGDQVYALSLRCHRLNFMGMESLPVPRRVTAKIRYAHKGEWCTIAQTGEDAILCTFEAPVRAVTPGQPIVTADGEYVLGGGTITAVERNLK